MTIKDGRITDFSAVLKDLVPGTAGAEPAPQVEALQESWTKKIASRFDEEVGQVQATLGRKPGSESPLGRWSADMLKAYAETDIGVYNPGGLRADLVAGVLTRRSLYEVFPFSNTVVKFQVSGAELIGLLLRNANAVMEGQRPAMQMSGVRCKWRVRAGVPEIVEARVGGRTVQPDDTYTAATNSYIIDRWSYNLGFEPRDTQVLAGTVFDAAQAMAAQGPIVPPPNPRMVRVD
jgi:2',3'-cyclic-nucleotide 2'-phosphodiesterase (5'-nucleotidase family)